MPSPFFLKPYGLAWRLARPFLRGHRRLSAHFEARLVPEGWPAGTAGALPWPFRLWIHASSGGEAYLARALMAELAPRLRGASVLCTSMTEQGASVLHKMRDELSGEACAIVVDYFPLDEPGLMREALARVFGPSLASTRLPCAVALLETEIWPGLLAACRAQGVASYILNGRMTERSLGAYRRIAGTLRRLAPDMILASDAQDASRFSELFDEPGKPSRVALMPNIKFDRAAPAGDGAGGLNPLCPLLAGRRTPVLLFASVRAEEEKAVAGLVAPLRAAAPEAAVIVAPRHMHRAGHWEKLLSGLTGGAARFKMRSRGLNAIEPGDIILWDAFGELTALYGLSRAVFVGGSLARLGGQNFLEPLAFGVAPVIGPYWSNFYWVGEEPFKLGLVKQVRNAAELQAALVERLQNPPDPSGIKEVFSAYLKERQGGAGRAADFLLRALAPAGGRAPA